MYTCEIIKEDDQFKFDCLDYRGYSVFRSIGFQTRDQTLAQLNNYLNAKPDQYIYEVCEGENCHYFTITFEGILLLESRSFDDKDSAYEFVENLKGGCVISHIIDKSFENGEVYYYLSCTSGLQFKSPIRVTIETEDGQFVASIPELKLFSYSSELKEVIEELKLDLDDLFDDLFIQNHTLSPTAALIKQELKSKLLADGIQ